MKANESFLKPLNGYLLLTSSILLIVVGVIIPIIMGESQGEYFNEFWLLTLIGSVIGFFLLPGFSIINPNESVVVTLFGAYKGTVKSNGFFWFNPFTARKKISLRARNLNSDPIKVNDKMGNPILIGIVLVWKVDNTFKAAFDVDNYIHFVNIQSEAAVRQLAGSYPYDNLEDEHADITLRSGGESVNEELERSLAERLSIAGIQVIEARISYLAYAPEIAGAMLQRQQATAVVAARQKIVEGAVGMVEMALDLLSSKEIVNLDEERKAAMVSNLMVVLCSDKAATPIVNAGTLHQ